MSGAMSIDLVINTCALGPRAASVVSSGGKGVPHDGRVYALRNFLLPYYCDHPDVNRVIVVGEWEEGEGYTYLHHPSQHFSCIDALAQRQRAFDTPDFDSTELIAFIHDDHWLDIDTVDFDYGENPTVIVPTRYTRLRGQRERLDPYRAIHDEAYVPGHCALYQYDCLTQWGAPWGEVPKVFAWDVAHTRQLRDKACDIRFEEDTLVYDIEFGGTPWR